MHRKIFKQPILKDILEDFVEEIDKAKPTDKYNYKNVAGVCVLFL